MMATCSFYGISDKPGFSAARRVWIDADGVFVDANLRGGGEYGEAWHKAGTLTHKQNVFDDFYAVARALVEQGYASASTTCSASRKRPTGASTSPSSAPSRTRSSSRRSTPIRRTTT